MRYIFALCLVLSLTGCLTLPPAVTFASWALGGITYAVSGKTISDHAISSITQEDCAVLRILQNQPVCREYTNGQKPLPVLMAIPLVTGKVTLWWWKFHTSAMLIRNEPRWVAQCY